MLCCRFFFPLWYYFDISVYQPLQHLNTSGKTFEIMIFISIFWYYHDVVKLSWYIKISYPKTLGQMLANIWHWYHYWYYHEFVILSWYMYLIVPFWYTLRRHIRRVWSSHGSYFGRTQSSQNTHGETKRAWYAVEVYQKDPIRYLPYPNSAQNLALR